MCDNAGVPMHVSKRGDLKAKKTRKKGGVYSIICVTFRYSYFRAGEFRIVYFSFVLLIR